MTPRPERYVVVLEAMPSEAPSIIRLRSFLKCALRSYRLKAVKITTEPLEPSTSPVPSESKENS